MSLAVFASWAVRCVFCVKPTNIITLYVCLGNNRYIGGQR
jgi:hypothetical protein